LPEIDFGGTLPQWGTFLAALSMLIGLITVYIKGIPDRHRVRIEETQVTGQQYAEQITEFRKEVHGYRNELHIIQRDLERAESKARQRADRIVALTVVVKLVMSELRRLDPKSLILEQAEDILGQIIEEPSETAADAAKRTVAAAEQTLAKVEEGSNNGN
jgi:dihydroxyacetone kinase